MDCIPKEIKLCFSCCKFSVIGFYNFLNYFNSFNKNYRSKTKMDYANYKGTDKGYKGKTGSSHGDQSATRRDYMGGSSLSKHMKSN